MDEEPGTPPTVLTQREAFTEGELGGDKPIRAVGIKESNVESKFLMGKKTKPKNRWCTNLM